MSSVSNGVGTDLSLTAGLGLEVRVLENWISFILEYGTDFTADGSTQYAFFSVTVRESLRLNPASMAHRSDATCMGTTFAKTSHAITVGRQDFSRFFADDPRSERLFGHPLRTINLENETIEMSDRCHDNNTTVSDIASLTFAIRSPFSPKIMQ